MTNCVKCKTRIKTHLWLVGSDAYCSPSCQRGKESAFEKTLRAIKKMQRAPKN